MNEVITDMTKPNYFNCNVIYVFNFVLKKVLFKHFWPKTSFHSLRFLNNIKLKKKNHL